MFTQQRIILSTINTQHRPHSSVFLHLCAHFLAVHVALRVVTPYYDRFFTHGSAFIIYVLLLTVLHPRVGIVPCLGFGEFPTVIMELLVGIGPVGICYWSVVSRVGRHVALLINNLRDAK